eukprot:ANDGO_07415.mRNA.1 hypothetical protein
MKRRIIPTLISDAPSEILMLDAPNDDSLDNVFAIGMEDIEHNVPILRDDSIEKLKLDIQAICPAKSFAAACFQCLQTYGIQANTVHYHLQRLRMHASSTTEEFRYFLMSVLYRWACVQAPHIVADLITLDDLATYRWKGSLFVLKDDLVLYSSNSGLEDTWFRLSMRLIQDEEAPFVDDLSHEVITDARDLLVWKWMCLFHPHGGHVIQPNAGKVEVLTVSLARRVMARLHDKECIRREKEVFTVRDISDGV